MKYLMALLLSLTGCCQNKTSDALKDFKRVKCICKAARNEGIVAFHREDHVLFYLCDIATENIEGHISDRSYVEGCD